MALCMKLNILRICIEINKIESDIVPLKDTVACAGIFDELMNQWEMNDK